MSGLRDVLGNGLVVEVNSLRECLVLTEPKAPVEHLDTLVAPIDDLNG